MTRIFQLTSGPSQVGGPGGPVPPHFLADQLTLSQPGGAHYPHPVLRATPDFQTLRRPCECIYNICDFQFMEQSTNKKSKLQDLSISNYNKTLSKE